MECYICSSPNAEKICQDYYFCHDCLIKELHVGSFTCSLCKTIKCETFNQKDHINPNESPLCYECFITTRTGSLLQGLTNLQEKNKTSDQRYNSEMMNLISYFVQKSVIIARESIGK